MTATLTLTPLAMAGWPDGSDKPDGLFLCRTDDDRITVLTRHLGQEELSFEPITFEEAAALADAVIAGEPRVVTHPLTQLALAATVAAIDIKRRQKG